MRKRNCYIFFLRGRLVFFSFFFPAASLHQDNQDKLSPRSNPGWPLTIVIPFPSRKFNTEINLCIYYEKEKVLRWLKANQDCFSWIIYPGYLDVRKCIEKERKEYQATSEKEKITISFPPVL